MRIFQSFGLQLLLACSVVGLATDFTIGHEGELSSDQVSRIDSLFKKWDHDNTPGGALGVIRNGELVYSQGYGLADLEHDVPIDASTVFYMASVSKHFVTMCILLLEEQGKLDLDDEIQVHLPDFPKYEAPLTIRHFIHHTSGVRDNLTLWRLAGNDILDHIDETAIYDLIKRQKSLNFPPGEQYLYSNSCYFMLGLIVERASGMSLKEYSEKHLFEPLGMVNTHFHDDVDQLIKNRAFSYRPEGDVFRNVIMRYSLVGSGGLYSNIEDMALWDRNFNDNRLGKGGPELIERMLEEGVLNNGESSGYACGLVNGEYRGLKTVSHSGALAGYRTRYLRFPEQKVSIVVLGNVATFDSSITREVAAIVLADELEPEESSKPTGNNRPRTNPRRERTDLNIKRGDFVGRFYCDDLDVSYEFFLEEGKLMFRCVNRNRRPMVVLSQGADRFFGPGGATIQFERDERQQVTGFRLDAGRVKNLKFEKE